MEGGPNEFVEQLQEDKSELVETLGQVLEESGDPVATSSEVAEYTDFTRQHVHQLLRTDGRVEDVQVGPSVAFYLKDHTSLAQLEQSIEGTHFLRGAKNRPMFVPCAAGDHTLDEGEEILAVFERVGTGRWEVLGVYCQNCSGDVEEPIKRTIGETYLEESLERELEFVVASGTAAVESSESDGETYWFYTISDPTVLKLQRRPD